MFSALLKRLNNIAGCCFGVGLGMVVVECCPLRVIVVVNKREEYGQNVELRTGKGVIKPAIVNMDF